jgi:hypothetical protein
MLLIKFKELAIKEENFIWKPLQVLILRKSERRENLKILIF